MANAAQNRHHVLERNPEFVGQLEGMMQERIHNRDNVLQRPVQIVIVQNPRAVLNPKEVNEVLRKDYSSSLWKEQVGVFLMHVATVAGVVGYIALIGVAVFFSKLPPYSGSVVVAIAGAFASLFGALAARSRVFQCKQTAAETKGVSEQYQILKDAGARAAMIQRINHPQMHAQLDQPVNLPMLQKGLAYVAHYQKVQADLLQKENDLRIELNQMTARAGVRPASILSKRIEILNVADDKRLAKVREAFGMLVLTDPSIKQKLDRLVTFREDLNRSAIAGTKLDGLVRQYVGHQFEDARATAFLTISDHENTRLEAEHIDQNTPAQLAQWIAAAIPQA